MVVVTVHFHAAVHSGHRAAGEFIEVFLALEVIGHAMRIRTDDRAGLVDLLAACRIRRRTQRYVIF